MSYIVVNTLSILLYFFYLFYTIKKYKWTIVPILLFVISSTWSLVSVYALDFGGIYIFELQITSTKSYATTFLVLCNLVLLESIRLYLFKRGYVEDSFESPSTHFSSKKETFINVFVWICLAAYYGTFLKTGIPYLKGIDRALYWELVEPIPLVSVLLGNYPLVALLIGFTFSLKRIRKKPSTQQALQFVLIILFFILTGNKFSALLDLILNFSLAPAFYGVFNSVNFKKIIKWSVVVILFFLITILIQSSTYSLDSKFYGSYGVLSYLFQRIFILQGEIWWKSFQDVVIANEYDSGHFWVELSNVLTGNPSGYVGLKYLMVQSARGSFIYEVIKGNYLYTGGFPAIILVTFPLILMLPIMYLLGRIFGFIILKLKAYMFTNSLIRIYLIYILYKTYNTMILSGEFDSFFILTNVGRVLMLIAFALLIYDKKMKTLANQ